MFKMSERPAAELNIKHLQVNSAAVLNQNICVTFFFRIFFFKLGSTNSRLFLHLYLMVNSNSRLTHSVLVYC